MTKFKLPSRTALSPIETRAFSTRDASLNQRHFQGHAAVFNQSTAIGDPTTWGFYERVAPGCFTKSIQDRADVIFDQDHDFSKILSRVSNSTLRLDQDSVGLATDADWADVSYATDLATLIEGRFIAGMSFMFQTVADDWSTETVEMNGMQYSVESRTLIEAKLIDVCVTSNPAYAGTDANMRSAAINARARRAGSSVIGAISPERLAKLGNALRVGATLSADTLATLQQVLDLIAAADNSVDQAQPILAALMGVPNPDADGGDKDGDNDGRSKSFNFSKRADDKADKTPQGFTPEMKKAFTDGVKDEETNPSNDIADGMRRLCEWAAQGHYPRGMNYDDLKWLYDESAKELKRRDPKSTAGGDFPAEKKSAAIIEQETRCHQLDVAVAAAGEPKRSSYEPGSSTRSTQPDGPPKGTLTVQQLAMRKRALAARYGLTA